MINICHHINDSANFGRNCSYNSSKALRFAMYNLPIARAMTSITGKLIN